jgi:hypothetical protein
VTVLYHISYDLRAPGRNYGGLYQEIKNISQRWCHPLDSTWYIVTDLSALQVRDTLWALMDNSDDLVVTCATVPGAWIGLSSETSDWLKLNLS